VVSHLQNLDPAQMLKLDLSGIKLIEASAGTGKTYTICNLYLRHILEGKHASDILVVTFTNAATEELRGRIRARLFETTQLFLQKTDSNDVFLNELLCHFQEQEEDTQKRYLLRLQLALRSMDEAAISTIHSFCARVLQDHALAGNQYFDNELLLDEDELWQAAKRDWWRRETYQLEAGEWQLLHGAIQSFNHFSGWLDDIRKKSNSKILPSPTTSLQSIFQQFKTLEQALLELSTNWNEEIADVIRHSPVLSQSAKLPYHPDNIDSFLDQIESYFSMQQPLPLPRGFHYLASDVLHENSKPSKRGQDDLLNHPFFASVNQINQRIVTLTAALKSAASVDASIFITEQVKKLKQSRRLLSYQDQLDLLLQALQNDIGHTLAKLIRQQFPVAMIDEFQDTDATQYEIFKIIYFQQTNLSLTLIGDPKQAIYSFRGGDIFTYMQAKELPGIQHYSLQTNWRSHTALVNAVNCFFEFRQDSFIYSDAIEFSAVAASPTNAKMTLNINGQIQAAMTLWDIPRGDKDKPLNKTVASTLLNETTANEIARLISGGQDGLVKIGDQNLKSGNIAVLVRNAFQGESLRQVLEAKGINAVTIGKDRVFQSDEALGLYLLLCGIEHYSDRQLSRRALTSNLLNFDYQAIADIGGDDARWQQQLEQFHQLHELWQSRGFIPMFQQLLQVFELGQKLAGRDKAERRLTNLLHLVELLQQQASKSAGMKNLLNWLKRQMHEQGSEETELRLESDQALVKIVTIHKSKGLEYPVVFLPYLWSCQSLLANKTGIVHFHNEEGEALLDLGSDDYARHLVFADKERLAEDIRLLYVALTRARSKVYLTWGEAGARQLAGNSSQTALAYLLHAQQSALELDTQPFDARLNAQTFYQELESFVATSHGDIELLPLPVEEPSLSISKQPESVGDFRTAQFESRETSSWRINSFSSLTRDVHQVTHTINNQASSDSIFNFPAGSHVGLLIHSILEHLDFESDIDSQCRELLYRFSPQFNFNATDYADTLSEWINQVLHTSLIPSELKLGQLSRQQRLNELSFDFALDTVAMYSLNEFLAERSPVPVAPLTVNDFRGLLTGVIDLVFEYRGKFYLADYKSNLLGMSFDDYRPEKLQQAMIDRRYDLQLLIYSIALHRYLGQRIHNYDYQTHFGGAYYLFLRAMRSQYGTDYGVYFERPELKEIVRLDQLFPSPFRLVS